MRFTSLLIIHLPPLSQLGFLLLMTKALTTTAHVPLITHFSICPYSLTSSLRSHRGEESVCSIQMCWTHPPPLSGLRTWASGLELSVPPCLIWENGNTIYLRWASNELIYVKYTPDREQVLGNCAQSWCPLSPSHRAWTVHHLCLLTTVFGTALVRANKDRHVSSGTRCPHKLTLSLSKLRLAFCKKFPQYKDSQSPIQVLEWAYFI